MSYHSLVKGAVDERQEIYCGVETRIPILHLYETQNIRLCECNVKFLVILLLIGISSVTVDASHVSMWDVERNMVLLSLSEQIKDV